jgi:two-component system sensor histidine kinase EvgS
VSMAKPSVEAAKLKNRLILVAEDSKSFRETMLRVLASLGYATKSAEDGLVALQMWRYAARQK